MGWIKIFAVLLLAVAIGFVGGSFLLKPDTQERISCELTTIIQGRGELWQGIASKSSLSYPATTRIKKMANGIQISSTFTKRPGPGGKTGGARFTIGADTEKKIAGQLVTIEVDLCATNITSGQKIGVAYSTASIGNSGWKQFRLRPGRASYCFDYKVPAPQGKKLNGTDYLGIISDFLGKGAPVNLHAARIYTDSSALDECHRN